MKTHHIRVGIAVSALFASTAFAQTAVDDQQRNVNQQERIEQGLQSGQLSTKEAGQLERGQQKIDHTEAKDLKNGSISPGEQAKLNSMENHQSEAIANNKHNAVEGNPNSVSSQRMQSDVQRNVNQQQRIANGMDDKSLNNREAGSLERGQAHVDRNEANAAENGHVAAGEQAKIQGKENHQSDRIFNKRHNARTRK